VLTPIAAPDTGAVAQTQVALDTISYNAAGEVFVGGRAPGAGMVRIYLDNVAVAADRVEDGQWDAGLPDVPPGRYTIRVDQLAEDGAVLSRVESPFQRESTAALAAVMADQTGAGFGGVAVKTVQPGHTLWAIARERYGDGVMYVNLFEANRAAITDPDLIYPGQVFVLPELPAAPAP
jgi:nucleoid-associated protein YgaU